MYSKKRFAPEKPIDVIIDGDGDLHIIQDNLSVLVEMEDMMEHREDHMTHIKNSYGLRAHTTVRFNFSDSILLDVSPWKHSLFDQIIAADVEREIISAAVEAIRSKMKESLTQEPEVGSIVTDLVTEEQYVRIASDREKRWLRTENSDTFTWEELKNKMLELVPM